MAQNLNRWYIHEIYWPTQGFRTKDMENYLKYRETHGLKRRGGGWWPRCSLYLMVIFFVIQNIYHIHIVCEQHNLIYERFLLSTAQKVYTTWVTVNKHGGSTPRGKKWSTCVSSWHDLFLVCALCIRLLWKLCKWS